MNVKPFPDLLGLKAEPPKLTAEQWGMVVSILPAIRDAARIGTPRKLWKCPTALGLSYDMALHSAMRAAVKWEEGKGKAFRSFFWTFAVRNVRAFWFRDASPPVSIDSTMVGEGDKVPLSFSIPDRTHEELPEVSPDFWTLPGLTHKQRRVVSVYFGLHGVGPWSTVEIGDRSEFSQSSAAAHLNKGLDRLRHLMKESENE